MFKLIALGIALSLAVASPVSAGALEDQLLACRAIDAIEKRVACYDAVVTGLSQTAAELVNETGAEDDVAGFGVPVPSSADDPLNGTAPLPAVKVERDDAGRVDGIEAPIREWSYSATGFVIIVLDNGQVWRQVQGDKIKLRSDKSHAARISRGALGAFLMTVDGSKRPLQVRRVDVPKTY